MKLGCRDDDMSIIVESICRIYSSSVFLTVLLGEYTVAVSCGLLNLL